VVSGSTPFFSPIARTFESWTTAVARVDGGVDLDRQELGCGVGVVNIVYARHDATGHADVVATSWVSNDDDRVLEVRQVTKLQGSNSFPEADVV